MRKITISRSKKFSGSAATVEIYINDSCYAQLKNGESATIEVENTRLRIQGITEMLTQGNGFMGGGSKTCKGNVLIIEEETENLFLDLDMKSNLSGLLPTLTKRSKGKTGAADEKPKSKFSWGIFGILFIVFFPAAIIYLIAKK